MENKITCISHTIQNCKKLKRLCLYRNQVQYVSNYINLCPLLYLNLSQNNVREITLCISTLMDLYLDCNAFIKIIFYNCTSLGILSLSHCFIYNIPSEWIEQVPNLILCNLDYNGLYELPINIDEWKRLKHLDLNGNCLTSIPNCLNTLDYLNLNYNYIKNAPDEIKNIKNIQDGTIDI